MVVIYRFHCPVPQSSGRRKKTTKKHQAEYGVNRCPPSSNKPNVHEKNRLQIECNSFPSFLWIIQSLQAGVPAWYVVSFCSALALNKYFLCSCSGNMGGRDSPRPGPIPQADETWTTVGRGPRNVSVDPKKFQNIKVSGIP